MRHTRHRLIDCAVARQSSQLSPKFQVRPTCQSRVCASESRLRCAAGIRKLLCAIVTASIIIAQNSSSSMGGWGRGGGGKQASRCRYNDDDEEDGGGGWHTLFFMRIIHTMMHQTSDDSHDNG